MVPPAPRNLRSHHRMVRCYGSNPSELSFRSVLVAEKPGTESGCAKSYAANGDELFAPRCIARKQKPEEEECNWCTCEWEVAGSFACMC